MRAEEKTHLNKVRFVRYNPYRDIPDSNTRWVGEYVELSDKVTLVNPIDPDDKKRIDFIIGVFKEIDESRREDPLK